MKKLLIIASAVGFASNAMALTLFDNSLGPVFTGTGSTPRTMMSGGMFMAGGAVPHTITSVGAAVAYFGTTSTTVVDIKARFSLWDQPGAWLLGGAATTAVWANRIGTYEVSLGGGTIGASTFIPWSATLGTPVGTASNLLGLQVEYLIQTTVGGAYALNSNFTSLISGGALPSVGSNIFSAPGGWFRNASGGTNVDNSLLGSDARSFATVAIDQNLYMTVQGVPEPGSIVAMVAGAAMLIARRRKA